MLFVIIYEQVGIFSNPLVYGPFPTKEEAITWVKDKEQLTTRKWSVVKVNKP